MGGKSVLIVWGQTAKERYRKEQRAGENMEFVNESVR